VMLVVLLLENNDFFEEKEEDREDQEWRGELRDDEEVSKMMIVFSISRFNDCAPDRLILSSLLSSSYKSVEKTKKSTGEKKFWRFP
jgi:hypothetical protein